MSLKRIAIPAPLLAIPLAVAAGLATAASPRASLVLVAGCFLTVFVIAACRWSGTAFVAFTPMVWGVLAANKSFATIRVGPLYSMEALLLLTILAVLLNPTTRRRLAAAQIPRVLLAMLLVVGVMDLARGHQWGLNAAKDSVIDFYAVATLLPCALFASVEDAITYVRRCALPCLVGALVLIDAKVSGGHALGVTPATAAALVACGFLFMVLLPGRFTFWKWCASALLIAGVTMSASRAVWLASFIAGILGFLVSSRERGRMLRIGVTTIVALALGVVTLSSVDSHLVSKLTGKAQSFLFHESSTSATPIANSKWRIRIWKQTIHDRIEPNLIAGEGFGRPAVAGTPVGDQVHITDPRTQVHDGYLTYLMRTGLIGFGCFAVLVLIALSRAARAAQRLSRPEERLFALAVFCAICLYLVNIAFGVIVEGPMGGIPFWLFVGTAFFLPRPGQSKQASEAGAL
jgi:hypothetical protein